jgi:hypothetical protein
LCGKNISTDTVSTIGTQRRFNYALQPMSRQRFIEIVTAELPDAPAYFTYDAVLNARERPTLERTLAGSSTRFRRSKRLLSSGLARNCWTRASRRSSKAPTYGAARTWASAAATRAGAARSSTETGRSC